MFYCDSSNYILWLPSWYPNRYEPVNGDFVQRHAQATSGFCPIVVCHFPQAGEGQRVNKSYQEIRESSGLKEIICYTSFKPVGIKMIDKLRYNIAYYRHAFKFLEKYFKQFGLPNLVHVHVPMKAGVIALWIKRRYGVNFIVSEHYSFYLKQAPNNFSQRHFIFRQQTKRIFRAAISATTVSNAIANKLKTLFNLKEVKTIRNVVDIDRFHHSFQKNSKFTFIHVSSFSVEKNVEEMLNAFEKLSKKRTDWQLIMVGPHAPHHLDFVAKNKLENFVEFTGEVQYEKVSLLMKAAHSLVLFSLVENFPCVIIEALCCGLTVVASNVGGIAEAVDTSNGILVGSKDETEFVRALTQVRENYGDYDSEKIAQDAASKYSYHVIGQQFFNLYSDNYIEKG